VSEADIPFCPGPPEYQSGPFPFKLPHGAVDTHAHVISAASFVPDRSYTSPEATEEQYIHMLDDVGMTFGVLIQVSVNGQDNEPMLRVLENIPKTLAWCRGTTAQSARRLLPKNERRWRSRYSYELNVLWWWFGYF
jgi:predicted TIM-barrel fold metal-dependent hydrolase